MFKYQDTEMGVEPPSILESRCSALRSQCQVPECLRFQMFPTWQISRKGVKHGKSIVNPQIHASCDVASNIIQHCLFLGFICETMLLAAEAGVHSVNRHAQCFPITNRNKQDIYTKRPRKKKFLRTFGDQSYAKPSTFGVLKSLVILGFLPQPHYNITKHNTKVQTCTNYWRTKQRVIESLCLECFLPMKQPHKQLIETSHNKVQIRAIQDWLDLNNDDRLRATHSSTDCNNQQYWNCQKSSSRSKSCHAWKSVECTVAYKSTIGTPGFWPSLPPIISWFFQTIKQELSSIQSWTTLDPSPS